MIQSLGWDADEVDEEPPVGLETAISVDTLEEIDDLSYVRDVEMEDSSEKEVLEDGFLVSCWGELWDERMGVDERSETCQALNHSYLWRTHLVTR